MATNQSLGVAVSQPPDPADRRGELTQSRATSFPRPPPKTPPSLPPPPLLPSCTSPNWFHSWLGEEQRGSLLFSLAFTPPQMFALYDWNQYRYVYVRIGCVTDMWLCICGDMLLFLLLHAQWDKHNRLLAEWSKPITFTSIISVFNIILFQNKCASKFRNRNFILSNEFQITNKKPNHHPKSGLNDKH